MIQCCKQACHSALPARHCGRVRRVTIVIKKAINTRSEAASQRHQEIQTTAVLALLVLATTLPMLEGGCKWHVCLWAPGPSVRSGFVIPQQVQYLSISFGGICAALSLLPKCGWEVSAGLEKQGNEQLFPADPVQWSSPSIFPRQLLCQLGALGKKNEMMLL